MSKLELSAYGVEEMTDHELEKMNGGAWLTVLGIAASIATIVGTVVAILRVQSDGKDVNVLPQPRGYPQAGRVMSVSRDSIHIEGPFGGSYTRVTEEYYIRW